jgi:hypothetical protein
LNSALRMLLDVVHKRSATTIAEGDEVRPLIITHNRDDDLLSFVDCGKLMNSAQGKDAVAEMAKQFIALPSIDAVVFISEAWLAIRNKPDLDLLPSEDPNRIECLLVVGYDKESDHVCRAIITRPDNTLGPLEFLPYEEQRGRFVRGRHLND